MRQFSYVSKTVKQKMDRIEKSGFKLRNTEFIVAGKLCHHYQYESTTLVVSDQQLMIDNEHHIHQAMLKVTTAMARHIPAMATKRDCDLPEPEVLGPPKNGGVTFGLVRPMYVGWPGALHGFVGAAPMPVEQRIAPTHDDGPETRGI